MDIEDLDDLDLDDRKNSQQKSILSQKLKNFKDIEDLDDLDLDDDAKKSDIMEENQKESIDDSSQEVSEKTDNTKVQLIDEYSILNSLLNLFHTFI